MDSEHPWDKDKTEALARLFKDRPGALMLVLRGIQDELGWVPPGAIPVVANILNLSRAEVHGVASFYHDFRHQPPGANVVKVCRAESCQAMGAVALAEHIERRLGCGFGRTSADGAFTLDAVYCLGNCACSPAVVVNGELLGRVTPQRFDQAIASLSGRRGADSRDSISIRPSGPNRLREGRIEIESMSIRIYVPRDSSAVSMGADAVAQAIAVQAKRRGLDVRVVRNGSRGLYWLEPMVEVEGENGRVAYGPVTVDDVAGLFEAGFPGRADHRLSLGPTEEIPYLKQQERLTFARVGVIDPVSIDDYLAHGGYRGLDRALAMDGAQIVEQVTLSGLRGRGGAGFPAGIKWKTTLGVESKQKYIVCNADEGDSGTFSDRMIMEGDPLALIEGMTIAAVAVGATEGYIYLRSEYPGALIILNEAIDIATRRGYLGENLRGSGKRFKLEVRVGAGAYICGEETAMLESLEGKRGMVRFKPPLPAISGLFSQPTIINNVITLASVPLILERGGEFYHAYGMGRSRGTIPIQLAGNSKRPGLIEKAFGVTLARNHLRLRRRHRERASGARGAGGGTARRLFS